MKKEFKELDKNDLVALSLKGGRKPVFAERSDLAQEIISRKPEFLEKWSLLIFLLLLLLLTAGTWFISYPDIIYANAVLTGSNAPKEIVARQTGKLTALFTENNQRVKQGEILGWIESNADTKEVVDLSERLDSAAKLLGNTDTQLIAGLFHRKFENLGELQSSYQIFVSAFQKYNDYLINGFYLNRRSMLRRDILSLQIMESRLSDQKNFTAQAHELAKKSFEMNEKLFREKVISEEEYRRAKSGLLDKQMVDPQMEISIISQQNLVRDKQKEIDQLDHDILQQQQTFEQALQTLRSDVGEWLRKYTIQAPANGMVVLTLPLQQNQHLEMGKVLGYVNPADSKYYVEIKLSQNNFGKVDTGMKVQLRFEAYPYQEVGSVPGTLSYISNIAIDSAFLGTVRLDKGLASNTNKTIHYKPGLKAQALIITKDMRLLERLYYSIVKSTSMNK